MALMRAALNRTPFKSNLQWAFPKLCDQLEWKSDSRAGDDE